MGIIGVVGTSVGFAWWLD